MRTLILAGAILLFVPMLRAQQAEPKENAPQAALQENTENSTARDSLPPTIIPGHPLDPADVDVLTGKRDREIEASRRGIPLAAGGYYEFSGAYALNGQRAGMLDLSLPTLQRIINPFFFFNMSRGSLGRRGFRGAR